MDTIVEPKTPESLIARLRSHGVRPTRQRAALADLLFTDGCDRHVSAESLRDMAQRRGLRVSLATVYNTLHEFTRAGLLREVSLASGLSLFDTNIAPHHHFWDEGSGRLSDIPQQAIQISQLPQAPDGMDIACVEVILHLSRRS